MTLILYIQEDNLYRGVYDYQGKKNTVDIIIIFLFKTIGTVLFSYYK